MHTSILRADRWSLAFTIIVAVAACSDPEQLQPPTAPAVRLEKAGLAGAAVITVTNTRGTKEAGSLRWAIAQTFGGETIKFDPRIAGGTILLDSTIYITHSITIEADSVRGMTLSGGNARRVIDAWLLQRGVVTLRNLTITGGRLVEGGGGAGIRTSPATTLKIYHSTFYGNYAAAAPAVLSLGPLAMDNSTVSNNTATGYRYAAISIADGATVSNSTIAFNSQAGIEFDEWAPSWMANTIVVNNGVLNDNCQRSAELRLGGVNVVSDFSCGDSTGIENLIIGNPQLAPLADNGGPTPTHSVTRQSIAFNATGATGCETMVDQRYKRRDTYCDVGSFEVDPTKVTLTIDPNVKLDATSGRALLTGTVTCSRDETFQLATELHQSQKSGKQVVDVHAASTAPMTCSTTAMAWSQQMVLTDGAWQSGAGQAMAQTYQAPESVTPASAAGAVKISIARK
jgi:hypothetical protein